MTDIAIVYGTTEGQTRKIARALCKRFTTHRLATRLFDAADHPDMAVINDAGAIIVAGSVHMHTYQAALHHFVKEAAHRLNAVPTAFISVSLSAMGDEEDLSNAEACVDRFLKDTGWQPDMVQHVSGALRYTKYDFFKRWVMKQIAKEHGLPIKVGQDYEFTDWIKLDEFADRFVASMAQKTG